jgi:NADH:ubiquinone oxidoreductase subunit 4 (subunit M)
MVVGFVLMLAFFTRVTLVALLGFAGMVMSAAWLVAILRKRSGVGAASPESVVGRMRRRWRSR